MEQRRHSAGLLHDRTARDNSFNDRCPLVCIERREAVGQLISTGAGLQIPSTFAASTEAPDCELRGHFVGHHLSGLALAFSATGDAEFRERGDRLVSALAECQQKLGSDGYLSAFPRSFFDRVAAGTKFGHPSTLFIRSLPGSSICMRLAETPKHSAALSEWPIGWTCGQPPATRASRERH